MTIWKQQITEEIFNRINENTLVSHLGIQFVAVGDDFLSAKMPVDQRTKQPYGLMHGGASCVLAETVASIAGHYCVKTPEFYCVGVEINTSHLKAVKKGWVTATAKPLHLGRTTQVWEIPIVDDEQQLISITRLRLAVLSSNKP